MRKCKLRNARPKALFGEAAAILTAAGMQVASNLASASMQSKAATNAARQQSDAIKQQAKEQAKALQEQNQNSKELQEQAIAANAEQNEENRELQKNIQLNLQLLTAQQNQQDRNQASRLVVKNGGVTGNIFGSRSSLRRVPFSRNMPFVVTDGGGVLPLGKTPEGFDLYEIIGNDHEHYHKTKGGKYKSGVGFKFANGGIIEGEGNQSSSTGELVLVSPNDAMFISKHSIKGFNPTKAVIAGMHPLEAFDIQESLKSNSKTPRRRNVALSGGNTINDIITNSSSTDINNNSVLPVATGIAYITQQNSDINPNNMNYGTNSKFQVAKRGCSLRRKAGLGINTATGIGAGIGALGNIGGAFITNVGNNRALRYITDANTEAGRLLASAYGSLQGINMNLIRREDFAAPHAMAAIQAPIVNTNTQRTAAQRSLLRQQEAIRRNSLSGAAAQNRLATAETNYNDLIGDIENQANKERQAIIQGNMERITQIANENANRDAQANREYYGQYLNALQYNNDIANQRILGSAEARASALTSNASATSDTIKNNATNWGNAINNASNTLANGLQTIANNMAHERDLLMTTDPDVLNSYYRRQIAQRNRRLAKKIGLGEIPDDIKSKAYNPETYIQPKSELPNINSIIDVNSLGLLPIYNNTKKRR